MHRSQLRAIQKRLRRTDRSCDRRKNAPREPNGVASDRKHAASGAKILPADRNGVARNANALGTTQKCCDRPRRNCSRRKKSSREPKRVARDRKTLGTAQKIPLADRRRLPATQMRCDRCQNGCDGPIAAAIDAKTRPANQTELPATENTSRAMQTHFRRTEGSCEQVKRLPCSTATAGFDPNLPLS